jgi:excisionase family DNA binding protein
MQTDELITASELADQLRVSSDTTSNWRRQPHIPAIRIKASTYRFDLQDVLAALKARKPGISPAAVPSHSHLT